MNYTTNNTILLHKPVLDGAMEVEVLMKKMVELQQQQEEECTQEEMVTRFERERSESIPTGSNMPANVLSSCHSLLHSLVEICSLTCCHSLCLLSGGAGSST